ncbi:MAG: CDP-alcohol phosphatidyltransferase family protein, partial [Proteobacteria bacterium]|nr:CDP-alcohol phosphatidyltransferase family protein [Pseudomonadota bacterium]
MSGAAKTGFFPLIRHLSKHITPLLIATPITANQITSVSLVLGLASAWSVMQGDPSWTVIGAFLLIGEYILDNCDGEVARIKNQCTEFGKRFDTFVDWLVHSAFFAGLGIGVASRFGSDIWLWLGWIAAAGGTVNYAIGLLMDARKRQIDLSPEQNSSPQKPPKNPSKTPETLLDWSVFMMR